MEYEFEVIYPDIEQLQWGDHSIIIREKNTKKEVYVSWRVAMQFPEAIELAKEDFKFRLKYLNKEGYMEDGN